MTRWFPRPWKTYSETRKGDNNNNNKKKRHHRSLSDIIHNAQYIHHYRIDGEIGYGANAVVHSAMDKINKTPVAIKELSKSRLRRMQYNDLIRFAGPRARAGALTSTASSSQDNLVLQNKRRRIMEDSTPPIDEVDILKSIDHNNIIRLYDVVDDAGSDSVFLVMELAKRGPVMQLDTKHTADPLPEGKCRDYFAQLVDAVDYLHSQGIIHRDIKPENLLLSDNDRLKLADFGSAKRVDQKGVVAVSTRSISGGTPAFMAPELLSRGRSPKPSNPIPGTAADIWAMGVTLYCFCYGRLPFARESLVDLYEDIRYTSISTKYPSNADDDLIDLLNGMLCKDPCKRITMDEIKIHPWMLKNT
ncbi:calcium calmodulin-dependent protein kinasekinase 1 [Lichtheimia corymbifera JMRC:FSU:9682]|uniref:Calcium calmodulin-dependent protein kinasekinase 1 n=1 Tax=Lichtheimia corymbifera JMRC:FSU:9682 TaxID=1263082 RepID=A0A068RIT4_9FUNG|nr:calcium calmodulin-dependent protein kinasekinase 1 [Lichtheimia corymbifera JMRC:FSU:9682]